MPKDRKPTSWKDGEKIKKYCSAVAQLTSKRGYGNVVEDEHNRGVIVMSNEWTRHQAEHVARMGPANLNLWLNGGLMSWRGSRVTAFSGTPIDFDLTAEIEPQLAALIKLLKQRDRERIMGAVVYGFKSAMRQAESGHEHFRSLQKVTWLAGEPSAAVAMVDRLVDDESFLRSFDRVKANELYQGAFDVLEYAGYTIRTPQLVEKLQSSPYYGLYYAEQADRILRKRAA